MNLPVETLKKILVSSGFVNAAEFDDAAKSASDLGKKIEDTLVFRGLVSEDALSKLIAEYLRVPPANIRGQIIPEEVLGLLPERLARSYRIVPFGVSKGKLALAMENPKNFEAIEFARRQTGLQPVPHYASA